MQTIYLDTSIKGVVPTIYAKQGDVGRKFKLKITENGVPYKVPDLSHVSVWYSGSSGEGNYTEIGQKSATQIDGNNIVVEMIAEMLLNEGEGTVSVVINKDDGDQIGMWKIPYFVDGISGFSSQGAKDYFTAFSNAVNNLPKFQIIIWEEGD